MPDPRNLWPVPRRSRWESVLDTLMNALELLGRYQVDSLGADSYEVANDEAYPRVEPREAAAPPMPPRPSLRIVHSRPAPRLRVLP